MLITSAKRPKEIQRLSGFKPTENGVNHVPTSGPASLISTNAKKDRERLQIIQRLINNYVQTNDIQIAPLSSYSLPALKILLLEIGRMTRYNYK